jgi:hypothetical protein
MAVLTTYPILNLSETYIRQTVYDNLPAKVRDTIDFEAFREHMNHDDYRYFASALSDLINDYIHESEIFTEFLGQAAIDTISESEHLSVLYVPEA